MSTPETLSLNGDGWSHYPLLPNEWRVRRVWEADPPEAAALRCAASVPGQVQHDLLVAGALPDPRVGTNSRLWEWTAARDWVYSREFTVPDSLRESVLRLRFEALDTPAHLFLNGEPIGRHDAPFVPAEFPVTGRLRLGEANRLVVVLEQPPAVQGEFGSTRHERRWAPRFAFGWEFAPRLAPIGISGDVALLATGPVWFRDVALYANLATDYSEAALSIVCEFGVAQPMPVTVAVQVQEDGFPIAETQDAVTVFDSDTVVVQSLTLKRIRLWWPNGAGEPRLYDAVVVLATRDGRHLLDARRFRFGLRRIEAVPCDDAPPDALPYALAVNGRRIWIQGWNWLPHDQFYGRPAPERYERLLTLARDAGVNLIRVWGGGLPERSTFYDLCDRLGLLVWQDFPLVGSGVEREPPSDPDFLDRMAEQAAAIIAARRNHASLAIWCGGSDLTTPDSRPLDSGHPTLRALRTVVETHDPQRLWLPASPSGPRAAAAPDHPDENQDVHGPWRFLGLREHPAWYEQTPALLHSAFGCEGAASLETLAWIGAGEPLDARNPIWVHHGGERVGLRETVEAAFGPLPDLRSFVRASQLLQAIGLQVAIEAHRRRQGRNAGVIPWTLNEPWPNAIGASAVEWSLRPKPAYWAVRRAYRALHVSARFPSFVWAGEREFAAEIWLHNAGEALPLLNVVATLHTLDGRIPLQENLACEAPAGTSECVGDIVWRLAGPGGLAAPFLLDLEVIDEEGEVVARNAYPFSAAPDPAFAGFLAAPATELVLERAPAGIRLRNAGSAPALWVEIAAEGKVADPDDNHFPLPPGGERVIALQPADAGVIVSAWNGPAVRLAEE